MMRVSKAVNGALKQFQALEMLELGYARAHAHVRGGYTSQLPRAREVVLRAVMAPAVLRTLGAVAWEHHDAPEDLRHSNPLYRLASYFVSKPSLSSGLERDTGTAEWTARIAGGAYLSQSLDTVAHGCMGRPLRRDSHAGIIDAVRAQNVDHNEKFKNRPVFGIDRADVYISGMRGHHLVYVRADVPEALCCVALLGATIDSVPQVGPNAVGMALDLPREHIADVLLEGEQLIMSNVRPKA